jgi:hypothetical protein
MAARVLLHKNNLPLPIIGGWLGRIMSCLVACVLGAISPKEGILYSDPHIRVECSRSVLSFPTKLLKDGRPLLAAQDIDFSQRRTSV